MYIYIYIECTFLNITQKTRCVSLSAGEYVCEYVRAFEYLFACAWAYKYVCACAWACECMYMHVCVHVCACVCQSVCLSVCLSSVSHPHLLSLSFLALLGCNNGIGGFHKNLVTFRGQKMSDFLLAQKLRLKKCSF